MHKFKYINSESSLASDAKDYFGFPKKNNSIETSKSPVWKIWGEFETFLENKQISKMRKKHLGDQIVINSYVYMFFNCDQS